MKNSEQFLNKVQDHHKAAKQFQESLKINKRQEQTNLTS